MRGLLSKAEAGREQITKFLPTANYGSLPNAGGGMRRLEAAS